jgi:hypothetical protein
MSISSKQVTKIVLFGLLALSAYGVVGCERNKFPLGHIEKESDQYGSAEGDYTFKIDKNVPPR